MADQKKSKETLYDKDKSFQSADRISTLFYSVIYEVYRLFCPNEEYKN